MFPPKIFTDILHIECLCEVLRKCYLCPIITAKSDEMRRAWAKIARDWTLMAEREEQRVASLNKNDPVSRPDSDDPPPSHD